MHINSLSKMVQIEEKRGQNNVILSILNKKFYQKSQLISAETKFFREKSFSFAIELFMAGKLIHARESL